MNNLLMNLFEQHIQKVRIQIPTWVSTLLGELQGRAAATTAAPLLGKRLRRRSTRKATPTATAAARKSYTTGKATPTPTNQRGEQHHYKEEHQRGDILRAGAGAIKKIKDKQIKK